MLNPVRNSDAGDQEPGDPAPALAHPNEQYDTYFKNPAATNYWLDRILLVRC